MSIISGLYTLDLNGEKDNLDNILNSYIERNLGSMSMMLVDKLHKIKDKRIEPREMIEREYRELERDIREFKEMEDTLIDERERRRIMEREEHKMEHGRHN